MKIVLNPSQRVLAGLGFGLLALLAAAALSFAASPAPQAIPDYCASAKPPDLPLPTALPSADYEKALHEFLNDRTYAKLGWCVDKPSGGTLVRDTGPYINNVYYGTHPAVRMYYSPEAMEWIVGDRNTPPIDGAIIVKEMFPPPAARYEGLSEDEVAAKIGAWTVMVRDASGAKDGWYWADLAAGPMTEKADADRLDYPHSGFGQYCIRCHASAEHHSTFSTLRNIKGFPGEPIRYRVDDSWRELSHHEKAWQPHTALRELQAHLHSPASDDAEDTTDIREPAPNRAFLDLFPEFSVPVLAELRRIPSEAKDRVVAPAEGHPGFLSSDQCMSCHGGLNGNDGAAAGPVLFLQTGPEYGQGYNVSHYGEWRWSPMGLAGRDPIFHAQLDTEIALIRKDHESDPGKGETMAAHLENLCLGCHATMGQRQLNDDAERLGLDPLFRREYLYLRPEDQSPYAKYGALGRDGVSCSVCHRIALPEYSADVAALRNYLDTATTGRFPLGKGDEIYGPFKDDEIVAKPMENALGLTPKHHASIQSSRLCGTCHTVNLPNLEDRIAPEDRTVLDDGVADPVFEPFRHTLEQSTYLEWLNSAYQDEYPEANPTPERAQSCQACHMPASFKSADGKVTVETIKGRIAAIQDETHPEADHLVPAEELKVRFREEGINRHSFQGLNAVLLHMFNQFNDVLGVRKTDFMTGANGLDQALEGYLQQARDNTVDLKLETSLEGTRNLTVEVEVTNKVGHRFPSGVGFRRAFIELLVIDESGGEEKIVWSSGRTNAAGAIVDETGNVLPTEFFEPGPDGKQSYQPHHEIITRQDQVQIYEELIQNRAGEFTTSFVRRDKHVKDNRLLPFGWQGRGPLPERYSEIKEFIDATHPAGHATQDEDYRNGLGKDRVTYEIALPEGADPEKVTVRATMYYQSIPPYWLRQRFETAPDMPATQRLFYIASHLDLSGTPLEDWKLKLVSASARLSGSD